ncbi:hypothetical protein [Neptuniibacter sp. QD37_11]|uniref:hypothetical protein n=1 Tax=Neptuniibacter sp. QD37_11 TaxID=3398209 RepID=UPI0039F50C1B
MSKQQVMPIPSAEFSLLNSAMQNDDTVYAKLKDCSLVYSKEMEVEDGRVVSLQVMSSHGSACFAQVAVESNEGFEVSEPFCSLNDGIEVDGIALSLQSVENVH